MSRRCDSRRWHRGYRHRLRKCSFVKNVTDACPLFCQCHMCPYFGYDKNYISVKCSDENLRSIPSNLPSETVTLYIGNQKRLAKLRGTPFSNLRRLERLSLPYNQLDSNVIESTAFDGLVSLTKLDLSYNRCIKRVSSDWFRQLKELQVLNLHKSSVEEIERGAFQENLKLDVIILNDNELKVIPESLFRYLPVLRKLSISKNAIRTLPPYMFRGTEKLIEVDFADNQLLMISADTGLQHLKTLQKLTLSGNAFECDCEVVWLRTWMDTARCFENINDTKCSSGQVLHQFDPNELQCGFPIIKVVTLSVAGLITLVAISICIVHRWRIRYIMFLVKRKVINHGYKAVPGDDNHHRYDAFISHSHKDQDWVYDVIYPTLENPPYNYKLCLDFRDFQVGELIVDNILKSVEESRKTVFILTKEFIESEWCYFELEMVRQKMFDEHRDSAILVLKDDIPAKKMPGLLKYFMRKGNHITWSENVERQRLFWAKLDVALKCHHKNIV
ncbi:toll-like receptor 6 [Glandiceps talaboti]